MKAVINQIHRKCDSFGCGHFGASRGVRKHKGVDIITVPSQDIFSPIKGKITKIGYPYSSDLSFRYVEISDDKHAIRLMYVNPLVKVGDSVEVGCVIGKSQTLTDKYPGITDHIHIEVRKYGELINPENLFKEDK